MKEEIVRIHNGKKDHLGNMLLTDIHLQISKGEIVGLIADNMSERRCLLQILRGEEKFTEGKVYYTEQRMHNMELSETLRKTVFVIDTRTRLGGELTIVDSVFIHQSGVQNQFKRIRSIRKKMLSIFKEFEINLSGKELLTELTPLGRIQVEVLKAYFLGYSIIILEDISSYLNENDRELFMGFAELLQMRGMAFLLLESDEEVLIKYSTRIYILRKGRITYSFQEGEFTKEKITQSLGGERWKLESLEEKIHEIAYNKNRTTLEFRNVSGEVLRDISFSVQKGELVTLLDKDSYRSNEIIELLQGAKNCNGGEIFINSKVFHPQKIAKAIKQGICFIEENPTQPGKGLFHNMSVMDNLLITMSQKLSDRMLSKKEIESIVRESESFFTKEQLHMQVSELNTLDQQRLVYYKWLVYYPNLVVCEKPLSGVDLYMKQETEDMIYKLIQKDISVLVITSNISEAYALEGRTILI